MNFESGLRYDVFCAERVLKNITTCKQKMMLFVLGLCA